MLRMIAEISVTPPVLPLRLERTVAVLCDVLQAEISRCLRTQYNPEQGGRGLALFSWRLARVRKSFGEYLTGSNRRVKRLVRP